MKTEIFYVNMQPMNPWQEKIFRHFVSCLTELASMRLF